MLCQEEVLRRTYLVENTKEIIRSLGSWSQSGIHADKGVIAKGSFVNIVERADFLISRVLPGENREKATVSNQILYRRLGWSQQLQPGCCPEII